MSIPHLGVDTEVVWSSTLAIAMAAVRRVIASLFALGLSFPASAIAQPASAPAAPAPAPAHVELRTSDGKGYVYVDGQVKGEGVFVGDLPAGTHQLEVRREGFETFTKTLTLASGQAYAETVSLTRGSGVVAGEANPYDRAIEGVYGGFQIFGALSAGGMGSDLETGCSALGATSCETPGPMGAGLLGFVGYTWNPVGFELAFGGMADYGQQKAHFDAALRNNENPLLASPARTEQFSFFRYGPVAALRARATFQTRAVRGTIAGGLGIAVRELLMERQATSADGVQSDKFSPDAISYISPAITIDAAVHWRVGPSTALSLGLLVWAENAGSSHQTQGDPNRFIGGGGSATPIATPPYHIATGSQTFIGPYLGMMFGP